MPSKYRKKSNARKNYYEKHVADGKENAHKYYQEHKETVQCRTAMKKVTDKTGKQKNVVRNRKKLEEDPTKCMKNRIRSRINTSQRIKVDREYREVNRARAMFNTSRRIEVDTEYREVNRARARFNTSRRIEADAAYKEQNRARANITTKQRLANNTAYHKQCIERAKAARKAKLQQKGKYWKQDCIAATIRKTKKRTESEKHCKDYNSRKTKEISAIYTARQMYWIKRRRKLSHNRKEQIKLSQQKKMQSMSSVFLLDVKLLFTKSEISLRKASSKLNTLHTVLSDKVVICA